jgi:hypothetical protein
MNTLPRAITAQFFPTIESYNALRHHWSDLMNSDRRHTLTAAHHLLYLALLGKDWRRAFTCPTNRRKLANGAFAGWQLFRALDVVRSKFVGADLLTPFDGLVTPEMLQALRGRLASLNAYTLHPDDFAQDSFPFEAYTNIETKSLPASGETAHA